MDSVWPDVTSTVAAVLWTGMDRVKASYNTETVRYILYMAHRDAQDLHLKEPPPVLAHIKREGLWEQDSPTWSASFPRPLHQWPLNPHLHHSPKHFHSCDLSGSQNRQADHKQVYRPTLLPCKPLLITDFAATTSAQLIVGSLSFILRLFPQVVLKDLEVLAEIASSPAGQTDDPSAPDGPDLRANHSELQVPTSSRANLLNPPSKYFPEGSHLKMLVLSLILAQEVTYKSVLPFMRVSRLPAHGLLPQETALLPPGSHTISPPKRPSQPFSLIFSTFDVFEPLTKHKTL